MNFKTPFDTISLLSSILKSSVHSIALVCLALALTGCLGTRFLKPGEKVFRKQEIKGNENVRTDELEALHQTKPNRRFLIIFSPYVSLYQMGLKRYDTEEVQAKHATAEREFDSRIKENSNRPKKAERLRKKKGKKLAKLDKTLNEGNLLMRWGEPLSLYDRTTSELTMDQMKFYLNSKGYFRAQVDYQEEQLKKMVKLTYQITESEPHRIDTIFFTSTDNNIRDLMTANQDQTEIEPEENYDQAKLEAERDRIYNLLKNNGYYDFNRQYITLNVDTAWGPNRVAVEAYIAQPGPDHNHRIFTIDSVIFTIDANLANMTFSRDFAHYQGITYQYYKDRYKRQVLDQRVFIYP